jgi:hypothetical protein
MTEIELSVEIPSTGKRVTALVDSLTTVIDIIDFLFASQLIRYQLILLFFSDRNV